MGLWRLATKPLDLHRLMGNQMKDNIHIFLLVPSKPVSDHWNWHRKATGKSGLVLRTSKSRYLSSSFVLYALDHLPPHVIKRALFVKFDIWWKTTNWLLTILAHDYLCICGEGSHFKSEPVSFQV